MIIELSPLVRSGFEPREDMRESADDHFLFKIDVQAIDPFF
jgi:hypothetical protein